MINNKYRNIFLRLYPAFSLVEIAVALVIIGLLVGAVLKGQDILHNARLNTLMTQVNQYRIATHTFMDRYGALPGDFSQASHLIAAHLKNGNHNGIIQGPGAADLTAGDDHQATSFWAHLAAADLIPDPGTREAHGSAEPNHGFPATKLGGGITITHRPDPILQGHWFVIGTPIAHTTKGGLLSPRDALTIMHKLDTTDPTSGSVQVRDGLGTSGQHQQNDRCLKNNQLNMTTTQPVCTLYIKL